MPEVPGSGCNDFPFGPVFHGLDPYRFGVNFVEDHLLFISAAGGVRDPASLVSVQGALNVLYCDENVVLAFVSISLIVLNIFGLCLFGGPYALALAEHVALLDILGLRGKLMDIFDIDEGPG